MRSFAVFGVALALWLNAVHLFYRVEPEHLRRPLANGLYEFWDYPERDMHTLRDINPEWDLMARMFTALSFANIVLSGDPLPVHRLDALIDETVALERKNGPQYFMLPYGATATRSLLVDGELALMLASRQLLEHGDATELKVRIARIEAQLEESPLLVAESYPDEGWVFCNAVALAALRVSDAALGTDHSPLFARWVASAKQHLVDPRTGMLISSFHMDGRVKDGPEGSTLWLAAHMLQLIDPSFAREQYTLARASLGHTGLGFGWASEWPHAWQGGDDVDSGPTIPLVDANAGSSGTALLGAAAFGDVEYHRALLASLQLAAFPTRTHDRLRFAAGNPLADAVTLYSLTQGPLWACVQGVGKCSVPRS
jgi:hypothetical protein